MNEEQKKKSIEERQKRVEKANRTKKSTHLRYKGYIDVINTPFLMQNKEVLNMSAEETQQKGKFNR